MIRFVGDNEIISRKFRNTESLKILHGLLEANRGHFGNPTDKWFTVSSDQNPERRVLILIEDRNLSPKLIVYNAREVLVAVYNGDMKETVGELVNAIERDAAGQMFCYECRQFGPRPGKLLGAIAICMRCWNENRSHCRDRASSEEVPIYE